MPKAEHAYLPHSSDPRMPNSRVVPCISCVEMNISSIRWLQLGGGHIALCIDGSQAQGVQSTETREGRKGHSRALLHAASDLHDVVASTLGHTGTGQRSTGGGSEDQELEGMGMIGGDRLYK